MILESEIWLALVVLLPLAGAILAFMAPRYAPQIGTVSGVIAFGAVIALMLAVVESDATRLTIGGWGAPLGIDLVADGLSVLMLLMTAIVGLAITAYAVGYFGEGSAHKRAYFWPLWLFLWASMNALFLSGDVFNLYVTLELLSFGAVSLTALVGKPAAVKAAMRYMLVGLAGSLMYLMGVAFLYAEIGVLDIMTLASGAEATPPLFVSAALITAGLMMKTALFPLHFWLPPAHANAAAPVSALLSALVVKGSFYILLRLWLTVFAPLGDTFAPYVLSALGIGAIIWGSIQALRQPSIKLLVAYSTVAQLGYLFLLIPLLMDEGANREAVLSGIVYFMIAHAMAKSAAFLSAGNILHALGNDRITSIYGMSRKMPLTITAFALAGISLIALPPSAGFIAKWLLLSEALDGGQWLLVLVIIAGGLLAAGYVMRVVGPAFRQIADDQLAMANPVVPASMAWSALGLAILAIVLGFTGVYLLDVLDIGVVILTGGEA